MTTPTERANAVLNTAEFLYTLCTPKLTPGVPKKYREQAAELLKHYPCKFHLVDVQTSWQSPMVCPFHVENIRDYCDEDDVGIGDKTS